MDTITDVTWGSSTTLRGKLIESKASRVGVGGQTITFSGTCAADFGSVTTNTDGTFTGSGLAPNTAGIGWTVQAHYAGDSITSYTGSEQASQLSNKKRRNLYNALGKLSGTWLSAKLKRRYLFIFSLALCKRLVR